MADHQSIPLGAQTREEPDPKLLQLHFAIQSLGQDRDEFSPGRVGRKGNDGGQSDHEDPRHGGRGDEPDPPGMTIARGSTRVDSRSLKHMFLSIEECASLLASELALEPSSRSGATVSTARRAISEWAENLESTRLGVRPTADCDAWHLPCIVDRPPGLK